jgi:uncharacterized damage-inducible protein DinB
MQTTTAKDELVEAIRQAGVELAERLRATPEEAFEKGGHENGWNGRQILAHIASVEWTYPRLLDLARIAGTPEAAGAVDGFDINAYNERQVEKRAQATIPELIAEFERNRAATVAAVEACPEELLGVQIRSVGGIEGTLAEVLRYTTVLHNQHHLADILGS